MAPMLAISPAVAGSMAVTGVDAGANADATHVNARANGRVSSTGAHEGRCKNRSDDRFHDILLG